MTLSKAALSLWSGLTSTVIKISGIKLFLNFSFWKLLGVFSIFLDRVFLFAFFAGGD